MAHVLIGRMTYREYLALEAASDLRYEYVNGEVFAMERSTIAHGVLIAPIAVALSNALRGRRCRILNSAPRIRAKTIRVATHADVMVVCDHVEVDDDDRHGVLNPCILVEVLSDSTEAYDRGAKAAHYRAIPSLREYILVAQDPPCIEVYRRDARGEWELSAKARSGERFELTACGAPIVLDVDEIYRDPLAT